MIGSYEVIGLLGVGGISEVYRARDTKLGRDVAVKILPEVFANDPERPRTICSAAGSIKGASLYHGQD
jgi:serine/threonine protein kinase